MSTVSPITGRKAGEFCRLLEERGIGDEEFQLTFIEGINDVVSWLRGDQEVEVYPIIVDYSQTLEQMIAAGNYDWKNSDITSDHFPIKGTGTVELEGQLVHFGRSMSSEAVIAELNKMGLRPGTVEEILAFGAKYPEKQRQFPIVGLGSAWRGPDGSRRVVCLGGRGRERDLDLRWFGNDWDGYCRFLAFRK